MTPLVPLHAQVHFVLTDREGAREEIARAQNDSGKVTLQDVYRAHIERDQLAIEIADFEG